MRSSASRAPGAWSVACPSATTAVRWATLSPTGTTSSTATAGWTRSVQLHATNNFPEFTGRLCPAPCEAACVLEIREGDAVSIKQIENSIIDRAWERGLGRCPQPPRARERLRSVAVVGAGPAGMAAAQQLRRNRHIRSCCSSATRAAGGLVRFGVPGLQDRQAHRPAPRRAAGRPRASTCAATWMSAST